MSTEILIALVTGGALTALIKGIFDLVKSRMARSNAFNDAITEISKVYEVMDELKSKSSCDRVLILSTKNGGGVPVAGSNLYASVLFETYDKGLEPVKQSWQNRLIDEPYIKILSMLEKENLIVVDPKKMDEGLLKDIYIATGVSRSIIAKIKSTPQRYYYISCSYSDAATAEELAVKVHTLDAVEKIRGIL